jgi:hypothetical protein
MPVCFVVLNGTWHLAPDRIQDHTEKGADIMCYQITMRTCTVAIYQTPRFKMPSPESGGGN